MNNKVKIEFIDISGKERIKAPFNRRFWYFVTLGKYGEKHHYKHVMVRKYFAVMDNRAKHVHQIFNGQLKRKNFGFVRNAVFNCRCSIDVIKANE